MKNLYPYSVGDNYYIYSAITNSTTSISKNLYNYFLVGGSIDCDDLAKYYKFMNDEKNILKIEESSTGRNGHITFADSTACNLNCTYCQRHKENLNKLNQQEVDNIFEYFINIYKPQAGGYIVSLNMQGEPLVNNSIDLYEHLQNKYMSILKERNQWLFISFITNGTLLTKENVDKMKELGITKQVVSLDGDREVHDFSRKYKDNSSSFDDTIKGIKLLQAAGIKVDVSCVVVPEYPDLYKTIMFYKSIGIHHIGFQIVRPPVKSSFTKESLNTLFTSVDKLYQQMFDDIKNNDLRLFYMLDETPLLDVFNNIINKVKYSTRCTYGAELTFDSNGDAYPCMGLIGKKQFRYGNYKDNLKFEKISNIIYVDNVEKCKDCWARYICGGHCKTLAYNTNNNILDVNEVECLYRKTMIQKSLNFYTKLKENNLLDKLHYKKI